MKKITHILLIVALVTGSSLLLPSCGGDDNGSEAIVLDGLWEITDIEILPVEDETSPEANEEGENTGGEEGSTEGDGEGEAGAGSPPTKAATEGETGEEEITTEMGFLRFELTTYTYFTVVDETITTLSSGTYLVSGQTLTLNEGGETDLPVIAKIDLQSNILTIEMTLDEQPQIWVAQKLAEDPYKEEEGEVGYTDFESEVHEADSVAGSLMNPDLMVFNETISGTLVYAEPYKAEHYYYLKVDPEKTYELKVEIIEADYSELPIELMKYVQVWLSNSPYPNNYKAEGTRIEPGEGVVETKFENLESPTGYLYIKLFSYQDQIKYQLTLVEQ